MRVWLYGRDQADIHRLEEQCAAYADIVVGRSLYDPQSEFPQGKLLKPMQAAMHGAIDLLLITERTLLGDTEKQIHEINTVFLSYGVSVKSACSSDNRSS